MDFKCVWVRVTSKLNNGWILPIMSLTIVFWDSYNSSLSVEYILPTTAGVAGVHPETCPNYIHFNQVQVGSCTVAAGSKWTPCHLWLLVWRLRTENGGALCWRKEQEKLLDNWWGMLLPMLSLSLWVYSDWTHFVWALLPLYLQPIAAILGFLFFFLNVFMCINLGFCWVCFRLSTKLSTCEDPLAEMISAVHPHVQFKRCAGHK